MLLTVDYSKLVIFQTEVNYIFLERIERGSLVKVENHGYQPCVN
jgi:hypothetical protein